MSRILSLAPRRSSHVDLGPARHELRPTGRALGRHRQPHDTGHRVPVHTPGIRAVQQTVVEPAMPDRFLAIDESLAGAMGPLSLALARPLADVIGMRVFCFAGAAGALVIASLRRFVPAIYRIEDGRDHRFSPKESAARA